MITTHYIFCCVCFLGTAEALAAQVTQEDFDKGLIFPPFTNIRKISAQIAAKVAAKAYELGESSPPNCSAPQICFPIPEDFLTFYVLQLISRFGYPPSSANRSGQVCRELHVQPCLPKLPVNCCKFLYMKFTIIILFLLVNLPFFFFF